MAGAPAGFTVGLAGTVTTAFIAIVLGIIAFLATVIQIMLMLVRGGMLVLLVGTLPLVAAFSNTEMGMQWFRKATAWLLAFALYKPAAAIVYAVAFDLAGQQGALALLDGVMMLVLAILALPALLRFVVPATSALAGGGGAGGMLAGAAGGAIAMRMPTGAARSPRPRRAPTGKVRAAARQAPRRRRRTRRRPVNGASGQQRTVGRVGGYRQRGGRAPQPQRGRHGRHRRAWRRRGSCGWRGQLGGAAGAAAPRAAQRRVPARSFRHTGRANGRAGGAVESNNGRR